MQKHKAEADLAVAAASILARNEFVTRLDGMGKQYGMVFPKGASAAVDAAAKEFIAKHGVENFPKVAKMHFGIRSCGPKACRNRRNSLGKNINSLAPELAFKVRANRCNLMQLGANQDPWD